MADNMIKSEAGEMFGISPEIERVEMMRKDHLTIISKKALKNDIRKAGLSYYVKFLAAKTSLKGTKDELAQQKEISASLTAKKIELEASIKNCILTMETQERDHKNAITDLKFAQEDHVIKLRNQINMAERSEVSGRSLNFLLGSISGIVIASTILSVIVVIGR